MAQDKSKGARGAGSADARSRRWSAGRVLRYSAKVLAPLAVLMLAIGSFAGLKATKPDVPQRPQREQVWPVLVQSAEFADFQPQIRLYGKTIAGRKVDLRALVGGEIDEIGSGLREGGIVGAGDLLLRIDAFQYEGAQVEAKAKLAEARAKYREIEASIAAEQDALKRTKEQLVISRRDLERAIPLAQKGTVSQKAADDRRMIVSEREQALELRTSNMAVQQARADQQNAIISQLEWKVREAKRNLDDTRLNAPFDAYVSQVAAEAGRIVTANDPVATLLDRDWIEVRFTLTNAQYGRIVAHEGDVQGRIVDLVWRIGSEPVRYKAGIERVAAEISAETGGVDVYARVVTPRDPVPLRPGAFVEVLMTDRAYSNVVRLPQTAVYGGDTVYVVEDGLLAPRSVELVGASGVDVLVRGAFRPGEDIMTTRLSNAGAGLKVRKQ